MPEKHYSWEHGEVPYIDPHSLAKHRILRRYIEIYVEVLMSDPRRERLALTLVDGFAGGGLYRQRISNELHPGSPLILLDAVPAAQARVNETRRKQATVEAEFIFVEKQPATAEHLRRALATHVAPEQVQGKSITICTGSFEDEIASILARIRERGRAPRAIFLLDQYGYSDVSLPTVQRIFETLPNAEIFMTLAVGWISAYLHHAREAFERLSTRMGITCPVSEEEIEALYLRADDESRRKRLLVQRILYEAFARSAGAKFFTPFFIVSRESHRPYWFLHLANNWRANDEVKKLHWSLENHFEHYGGPGMDMILGYDPQRDSDLKGQRAFDFGSDAQRRTKSALRDELPRRIAEHYRDGVTVRRLFEETSNEMPATQCMLAEVLTELVSVGELHKVGSEGEARRPSTLAQPDDVISPSRQRSFPFIKKS